MWWPSAWRKRRNEISHWAEYDYVVINDDLDTSLAKIKTILAAERMKRAAPDAAFARFRAVELTR